MQSIPTANRSVLDGIAKQFDLSDARLQDIAKKFVNELRLGLGQDSAGGLPMMSANFLCGTLFTQPHNAHFRPTLVTRVPNGTETG